jgi:hypothetical protein
MNGWFFFLDDLEIRYVTGNELSQTQEMNRDRCLIVHEFKREERAMGLEPTNISLEG